MVSHGDEKSVVLYWYQSPRRVIASEFSAKLWLVMDSIRYRRSDTALVRVSIPVSQNDEQAATRMGVAETIRSAFAEARDYKDGDVVINDPGTNPKKSVRHIYKRKDVIHAWAQSYNTVYLVYPVSAQLPKDRYGQW